jgi:hypothetical protein
MDVTVITAGDDKSAAEAFLAKNSNRVVWCGDRLFCEKDGVYIEGEKAVRIEIMRSVTEMHIMVKTGRTQRPYSRNASHAEACVKMVLADSRIESPGFVDKVWEESLGHLNFANGVYSFYTGLISAVGSVPFLSKIPRGLPVTAEESTTKELFVRVLDPIFPKKDQQNCFFHRVARAMAGCVTDKQWYVLVGERNSGKGVVCLLLEKAFREFVVTFNAASLLQKTGNSAGGDEAKKLSWLSEMEFKRFAVSNEVVGGTARRLDGNLIKMLASGGDTVELRQNYRNEQRKKLQCTFALCCNDLPDVEPSDALDTCVVFNFASTFVAEEEWNAVGCHRERHWRLSDPGIKEWVKRPEVLDAFTRVILSSFSPDLKPTPACVREDTSNFKGATSISKMRILHVSSRPFLSLPLSCL